MKTKKCGGLAGVIILFVFTFILLNSSWSAEQKYPSRPIEFLDPFTAGSVTDLVTRFAALKLESYLGVPVVPQNKPGAGGMVLASLIANARPDGYTIGNMVPEHIIQPILLGRASYSLNDFYIIGQLAIIGNVLYTSIDLPWNTFQEFADYARKNPGVKYAHPGVGSALFLRTDCLNKNFNLGMKHLPFTGHAEVLAAVLGKHVVLGAGSASANIPQVNAGKTKILFSFEPPDKMGLPSSITDLSSLYGSKPFTDIEASQLIVVPGKTPPEVTQVLKQAWAKLVKDKEFGNFLKKNYLVLGDIDGETFTQRMPKRMAVIKEMLQDSGQLK